MFKKLLERLFGQKSVEQTGFIHADPRPTDYLEGTLPYELLNKEGDWFDFLPLGEDQLIKFKFDTMSCVTFSALNNIEMQLKKITGKEFNFSDRFIAIMSGTTRNGNTLVNVADAIRKYGLIPEEMLPFGGNTFEEYHNKNMITDEMLKVGQEFLKKYDIGYEWIFVGETNKGAMPAQLKHAPLQVAIPMQARHAVALPNETHFFDSYSPYYKKIDQPMAYGFKLIIKEKTKGQAFGILKRGSKGQEVKDLQKELSKHIPNIKIDGDFGPTTERVVKWLQTALGLTVDGVYGNHTKTALELQNWLPITNFNVKWGDKIEGLNRVTLGVAQRLRNDLNDWVKANSGRRTVAENNKAEGASDSAHLTGLAMDYSVRDRNTKMKAIKLLKSYGVIRIGEYARHDHFDLDLSKPQTGWIG